MLRILRRLDQSRFLGLPIWEFSFRSLPRRYGRLFLREIAFRHPVRTWRGLSAYRGFYRHLRPDGEMIRLFGGDLAEWRQNTVALDEGFLVALGYCQKPLDCPAGRFNHDCYALTFPDLLTIEKERLAKPCRRCDIRATGRAALAAGASFYIMTSAEDIAHHMFIPTLRRGRFQHGLFVLCAYSAPAMILPLLICGIQAMIVSYSEGDCRDYPQFLAADVGIKDERTQLHPSNNTFVLELLQTTSAARQDLGEVHAHYRYEDHLFVPVDPN